MWLPMHFAMSIPDVSIADVDLLHSAQPGDIHRNVNDLDGCVALVSGLVGMPKH